MFDVGVNDQKDIRCGTHPQRLNILLRRMKFYDVIDAEFRRQLFLITRADKMDIWKFVGSRYSFQGQPMP